MELQAEFDRQIKNLTDKGFTKFAEISEDKFVKLLLPLRNRLTNMKLPDEDFDKGTLPFVIVVKSHLVSAKKAMNVVERKGNTGVVKLDPLDVGDFQSIDEVNIPDNFAYLMIYIDRGRETLNVRPKDALTKIRKEGRSPLTIDEGVAIITHYPEFLIKNNCFSLLASRTSKDKRVPAICINAKGQANLGWCWEGNP